MSTEARKPCPFCGQPDRAQHLPTCWFLLRDIGASRGRLAQAWNLRSAPDSSYVIPPPRGTGSQQEADSLDDLYGAIMNLPCERTMSHFATQNDIRHYKEGHLDARVAAAGLALKLATRCRAEGGNTSENMVVDKAAKNDAENAETRMDSGFAGGGQISAPAAGTDKDAAQRVEKRIHAIWEDSEAEWGDAIGGPPAYEIFAHRLISAMQGEIDAAIEAHNKAGKPTPKGETK